MSHKISGGKFRKRSRDSAPNAIPSDWQSTVWRGQKPMGKKFRKGVNGLPVTMRNYNYGQSIPPQPWRGHLSPNNPRALFSSRKRYKARTFGNFRVLPSGALNYGAYWKQKYPIREIPAPPPTEVLPAHADSYYWGDMYQPGRGYAPGNDPEELKRYMAMNNGRVPGNPGPGMMPGPGMGPGPVLGPGVPPAYQAPGPDMAFDPAADVEDEQLRALLADPDAPPRYPWPQSRVARPVSSLPASDITMTSAPSLPRPTVVDITDPSEYTIGSESGSYPLVPAAPRHFKFHPPDHNPLVPYQAPVTFDFAANDLVNIGTDKKPNWKSPDELSEAQARQKSEIAQEVLDSMAAAARAGSNAALQVAWAIAVDAGLGMTEIVSGAYKAARSAIKATGSAAKFASQKAWSAYQQSPTFSDLVHPPGNVEADQELLASMAAEEQERKTKKLAEDEAELARVADRQRKAAEKAAERQKREDERERQRQRDTLRQAYNFDTFQSAEPGAGSQSQSMPDYSGYQYPDFTNIHRADRPKPFKDAQYKYRPKYGPGSEPTPPPRTESKRDTLAAARAQAMEQLGIQQWNTLQNMLSLALHPDQKSNSEDNIAKVKRRFKDNGYAMNYINQLLKLPTSTEEQYSSRFRKLYGPETDTLKGRGMSTPLEVNFGPRGTSTGISDHPVDRGDKYMLYLGSDLDRRSTQDAGRGGPGFTPPRLPVNAPTFADHVIPGVTPQMFNLKTGDFTPQNPRG